MDSLCCQVAPDWSSVAMNPSAKEEEEQNIILINDDDDEEEEEELESTQGSSVLLVELQEESPPKMKEADKVVENEMEEGEVVENEMEEGEVVEEEEKEKEVVEEEEKEKEVVEEEEKEKKVVDEEEKEKEVVEEEEKQKKVVDEEEKEEEIVLEEDEDLVVTYCKQANVMPHARYDCTTHPFVRAECETCSPLGRNGDICVECYCYICDKPAVECRQWTTPSLCHCNAHNKSTFWKAQRSIALAGVLASFHLELQDMDAELRHGGDLLEKFIQELAVVYNTYLRGETICPLNHECHCVSKLPSGQCGLCNIQAMEVVYKYSGVFELVTRFLNQAEQEKPKAAAVMLLGAAKQIAMHKDPALLRNCQNLGHTASLRTAVPFLFQRITTRLQRMLVLCDFPKFLWEKFIQYFQSISLPCHLHAFTNCLNVLPWHHMLLTTVLKGQNTSGHRRQKGRKMHLWEAVPVVEARVEKLLDQKKYREVVRYLRAVKCSDQHRLRDLRDMIPFYLCKAGNFLDAAHALLLPVNNLACCSACRITPCQFKVYLKMFRTGCVPPGNVMVETGPWVSAGPPLRDTMLTKQALKLLYSSETLYRNVKCWSTFIMILGSSNSLEKRGNLLSLKLVEPPPCIQEAVLAASSSVLEDLQAGVSVSLPSTIFCTQMHNEASLILGVQALHHMLFYDLHYLTSFLEIVLAFGTNFWALKLLLDQLSREEHILCGTVDLLLKDLGREKDTMLRVWENLGPQYVGEFLCLFLANRHKKVQTIGLYAMRLIVDNLCLCPWTEALCTFFRNSGLKQLAAGSVVHYEVSKFVSTFGKP